ncbi:MHYT domain-containing protein [Stutzerimonas azotifigens]|uniref:histidine kinase n=1 Tax=Stutzerimonas azotifigens TaxID=291995 RepID=A0ABR5Z7A3_9GAMM|nr:MHYT domain-containing protein [Stutzerimonas azotifigens]MBA1276068.1 PAS domain S-box protein [Stutzerimonas azotifigens]
MHTTYNIALVCLSILIAITASFTALDLASRARASVGWIQHAWLGIAALCMGGGIWSMHFVGMLAFGMPGMEINYDLALTFWSLVVPIVVTAIAFFAVSTQGLTRRTLAIGGVFMGLGIGSMHYMGMAAMTMHAELSYDPPWVVFSFAIAIGAATVALWLSGQGRRLSLQSVAAVVLGFAVSGMHYAAMAGARFTPLHDAMPAPLDNGLDLLTLALAVAGSTFLVLFLGLTASMYDRRLALIGEREAAALRQSEERFRALYSKTPLPLHSLDQDGRLEYVSDAWLELLGYGRDEVIGRPLVNFMTETSARQLLTHDWPRLMQAGELYEAEYRVVTKAGEFVDVLASARLEQSARGRFVLGGLANVTERRRAESALRQAQKMEAIGKLTGGIAHDFNNLLAVIVGNLELLRKRLPPPEPRIASLIENALQGAQRGASLTQRMLAFARKQELRPESISLPDLVLNMSQMLQRSVGSHVHIETRFPLGLPLAYVDANQLELVLINLVVNARDAMPNGGTICIKGEQRTLNQGPGQPVREYVALVVRDEGCGMSPDTLARATEPFFTTKGTGKGTGLGLSMAQGLAEQSGGRLNLESSLGQGTTIELWLPLGTPEPTVEEPPKESAESTEARMAQAVTPLRILVVDDDPLVLTNTVALLEDVGHQVASAADGQAALTELRGGNGFDILVTDQMMPGLTGTQLADIVAKERPELPVLLVSGFAELPEGSGRLQILAKPFTQASLMQAIGETIGRPGVRVVVPLRPRR